MLLEDRDIGRTAVEKVRRPALYLHCAIFLGGDRVVSDEMFRLVSVRGEENVSEPFEFQLDLRGNTLPTGQEPLRFADIIGRRVTFAIQRPYTSNVQLDRASSYARFHRALGGETAPGLAFYNGIASAFAMHEPGVYRMTVKPGLWKLTLNNRYCVYAQRSIKGAIAEVFQRYPDLQVSLDKLADPHNIALARTQDWLQAGETDYEFVQRLMSKAHLYYYFEHGPKDHRLVFANTAEYPQVPGGELRYTYTSAEPLGLDDSRVITQYGYEQTLTHTGVQSMFVREEAAWEKDTVAQLRTFPPLQPKDPGERVFRLYKIYQYGGSQSMTTEYTDATLDAIRTAASRFSGASHCAMFHPGYKFRAIEDQAATSAPAPVRPTLDGEWFVLTQVRHEASLDGTYRNEFTAAEAHGLIAPTSVRDTHQGSVLATVVEIDPKHGQAPDNWKFYTKNNFDPEGSTATDTESVSAAGSSRATDTESDPAITPLTGVYVRFSSDGDAGPKVWVKLAAHMQTVPEIGTNVMVGRASDESEMPEIQAIVQANGQMTVTPSRWTAETRVGSTHSTSYGDNQTIRYGKKSSVDLKKAIDILNREYNPDTYHDVSYSKGARFSYETSEQGRNGPLSKTEAYGSTYSRAEAKERRSYEDVDETYSEQKVGKSYSTSTFGESENHHTVERNTKNYETVAGNSYSETTHGSVESHSTVNATSTSYETIRGKRYSKSTIAEVENDSTVTGDSTSYDTVKGDRYSKSRVEGLSESVSEVPGVERNTRRVGVSNSNNAVGLSNDNSITGIVVADHTIGMANQINATVNSNTVNATAMATEVSATGVIARVNAVGAGVMIDKYGAKLTINGEPASLTLRNRGMTIEMTDLEVHT